MNGAVNLETIAVSSRIRLARNFADYPFPAKLLTDPHAEEQSREITNLVMTAVSQIEKFTAYDVGSLTAKRAEYLAERSIISRDLIRHRKIAAALVSQDNTISVMINEEDHIREQYFVDGFDLSRAYERLWGIDDVISESIPFAFDETFGYLTACPTNLGTGLRASVMLFLPALSRRGRINRVSDMLTRMGLTMRGVFGEGSGAEGDMVQVSNEVTLGLSEAALLENVEKAVLRIAEMELCERGDMKLQDGIRVRDIVQRARGILTNCALLGAKELAELISDLKMGIALGYFGMASLSSGDKMRELDKLVTEARPANIGRLNGAPLTGTALDAFRAAYVSERIRGMDFLF